MKKVYMKPVTQATEIEYMGIICNSEYQKKDNKQMEVYDEEEDDVITDKGSIW